MSAASRSIQATPNTVKPGVTFAAILLTAAVALVLVAVALPAAGEPQLVPAAGSAPAMHDRGWATAGEPAAAAPILHDRGSSSAANAAGATTTQTTGVPSAVGAETAGPDGARRHR